MSVSKHSLYEFESVWCKIVTKQKTIKIGVIYRPPGHAENIPDKLITLLENQIDVSVPTIVASDFNYGHIDWQNCTATRQYGQEKFMNFILGQGMSQLITFLMRNQAILDLLFVNEPNLIQGVESGTKITKCDHETITALLTFQTLKQKSVVIRNYRNADFTQLNHALVGINWVQKFLPCQSVSEIWDEFLLILTSLVNFHIPQRTITNLHKSNTSIWVKRLCRKAWKLHKTVQTE
ncbi:MAG: hypothetical protein GY931_17510 [Maribacter sp.]|nr:hypothetical protein [Maribacter sp.]